MHLFQKKTCLKDTGQPNPTCDLIDLQTRLTQPACFATCTKTTKKKPKIKNKKFLFKAQLVQNGPNEPKWTKKDWNRPNGLKWTEMD